MGSRPIFVITMLWALSASAVPAQTPQPLSLSEAVRLAQAHSALSRGAQARVAAAEGRLRSAGALPNPSVALAKPFGHDTGGLDEDVLLTQTVELGDKRRHRIRAARAERDAALSERSQTDLDVTYSVQSAYYEALRADAERQLAADTLERSRAFARAAETQFQAGDVPRSNVVRSQIEVARAEQALAAAETDRANRHAGLRSLTGLPETTTLMLTDTLTFTPVGYQLADLQSLALHSRPDLRQAELLRDARAATVREVRSRSQPDFFVEGRHATLDPSTGGSSLRVGLTAPLFDLGRNRGDAREAAGALQEQQAVLDEATRVALLEVADALRNVEQARQAVESFRSGRLERDRQLLEMAQIGYEHGANTYLELLDAQGIYRAEQAEYERALAAFNTATAALQRAVGGKLP